ncbi:MAG: imelysin family protein, partial [Bacteroidota bacterium]
MKNWYFIYLVVFTVAVASFQACSDDETGNPELSDFTDQLTNQIDEVILPTVASYKTEMANFESTSESVTSPMDEVALSSLRNAFQNAYMNYQSIAMHDYFANSSLNLVKFSNLYPIEVDILENLIETGSRDFNSSNHERANGFPAIDYMLYGPSDVIAFFNEDDKRLSFLKALITNMKERADNLDTQWNSLRDAFVEADGVSKGSAISGQLNGSSAYYEFSIREDKVGIPIGRLG